MGALRYCRPQSDASVSTPTSKPRVDAVEDLTADADNGAWNPLLATGTDVAEARRLCDDALLGIRLALDATAFTDDRLVRSLLVRELARSVHRVFARTAGPSAGGAPTGCGRPAGGLPAGGLSGLLDIRRHCWCERYCCCEPGQEACCESGCEACCDSCDCSC